MENKMTYASAIAELEDIVEKMKSEECGIDNLSEYTKRSLVLLKFCKEKLLNTDEEVKKILEELDK